MHKARRFFVSAQTSIISVRASGFDGWQYKINAREKLDNPLIAVLRIASYYGPTLVNAEPGLETELQPPIAAVIPPEHLESLIDCRGANSGTTAALT